MFAGIRFLNMWYVHHWAQATIHLANYYVLFTGTEVINSNGL